MIAHWFFFLISVFTFFTYGNPDKTCEHILSENENKYLSAYQTRDATLSIASINDLPIFDSNESAFVTVHGIGKKHEFLRVYGTGKNKVFVKYAKLHSDGKPDESSILNEARWLIQLSKFKHAPKFLGIHRLSEGLIGLATEYFEGHHIRFLNKEDNYEESLEDLSSAPVINQGTVSSLVEIRHFFAQTHIFPLDLQFRVSQDGNANVIDPEQFITQEQWTHIAIEDEELPYDTNPKTHIDLSDLDNFIELVQTEVKKRGL
ncbi:MAG: hypothetical protein KDD40_11560 [Bdellovibrionales bacterium]|nr:hypothetical protein [Bdellovibrionales bacterium]